uniref:Putative salivary secreted protein n=1 Tax=Ornithodoros turicata TaxID=34597 RepID=A0A2R5L5U4_9ACAR
MATAIFMVLLVALVAVAAGSDHPWEGGKHSNCDIPNTAEICGQSAGQYWPELWIYQSHRETCDRKKVCPALLSFAFKNHVECSKAHKRCEGLQSCLRRLGKRHS